MTDGRARFGWRHGLALLSWGLTVTMMQPALASLAVAAVNAGLLAWLTLLPRRTKD